MHELVSAVDKVHKSAETAARRNLLIEALGGEVGLYRERELSIFLPLCHCLNLREGERGEYGELGAERGLLLQGKCKQAIEEEEEEESFPFRCRFDDCCFAKDWRWRRRIGGS